LGALPRVRCGWHRPNVHSKHTHSRDTLNRIWQPRYRSVCDDVQTAGRGTQRCWLPRLARQPPHRLLKALGSSAADPCVSCVAGCSISTHP
jgi:hypothetical protein